MSGFGIAVRQIRRSKIEIQSPNLEEICIHAAREVSRDEKRPFIIEDSGLFISGLKGFPGPYSSYVRRTIGIAGILRIMEGLGTRDAYFQSSVVYASDDGVLKAFLGKAYGAISHRESGKHGFGYDPIFVPRGNLKTFGQMSLSEKNRYSHRAMALRKFAEWFLSKHRVDRSPGTGRSPKISGSRAS